MIDQQDLPLVYPCACGAELTESELKTNLGYMVKSLGLQGPIDVEKGYLAFCCSCSTQYIRYCRDGYSVTIVSRKMLV